MIGDYWFQGVGYGNEAFSKVYPNYAYSGMESAAHSHSLFLQIIATMGVFALVIFAIAVFLNVQKCFEYTKNPQNKSSKIYVFATICSLAASLVMGMFDYIWYSPRVFYIFWVILAIGCAFVRSGNYEMARTSDEVYENNVVEKRDSK